MVDHDFELLREKMKPKLVGSKWIVDKVFGLISGTDISTYMVMVM